MAERDTLRNVNPGAEKWLGQEIKVLDHGFVYLVDYMGSDQAIVQAARVSYGLGTKVTSGDRGLVRYLLRNKHTSPFEMAELKFHAKMPIFVARQWVRHRTANINEISGRYSILRDEFYLPEPGAVDTQSDDNKQGRGAALLPDQAQAVIGKMEQNARETFVLYHSLLNQDEAGDIIDPEGVGIAKELARTPLPLSTYTEWYWKIDLHNLLHFLRLRKDPHAQLEMREYANAMGQIVKDAFPYTWEAFEDYVLKAETLSGSEIEILLKLFSEKGIRFTNEEIITIADEIGLDNKREREEMFDKLRAVGLSE